MSVSLDSVIAESLTRMRQASTHPAKMLVLSRLLENVFGVTLEDLVPGIEMKLGSRILGLRGRADLLLSGVVFEIKIDLARELEDAHAELRKYFQALTERDATKKYIAIVTDGIKYLVYVPIVGAGLVTDIKKVSEMDASTAAPADFIVWLDSFIFSKSGMVPTADDMKWRFGSKSASYGVAATELQSLWTEVQGAGDVNLKLSLWSRNMQIVYGSEPSVGVFLGHTYLVTLAKLLIYLKLSGDRTLDASDIRRALSGEFFDSYGISNLIEEDFFSWVLHPQIADRTVQLSRNLCRALLRYDISQVGGDLFKEIYEELVELGQRHMIGEYYTPEWLSELVVTTVLKRRRGAMPRILDPACGSGTFLTDAIKLFKSSLSETAPDKALRSILSSVCGLDINPLAVIIARANYVITLGDMLRAGTRITIPVHLSDGVKLPNVTKTYYGGAEVYEIEADSHRLQVPIQLCANREAFDAVMEVFREAVTYYKNKEDKAGAKHLFERLLTTEQQTYKLDENDTTILRFTFESMLDLADHDRNSVWVFMLSNIYFPIALRAEPFDIIVGNPPWLVMRSIENENYQNYLKEQVFRYNLLNPKEIRLFTHMEMATLYFCRASDLYLRENGIIAFLMPISVVTGAQHHARFQHFSKPKMQLLQVLDFKNVEPIFSLPVCVLIAKKGQPTRYPVRGLAFEGKIGGYRRNEGLAAISPVLKIKSFSYRPATAPTTRSHYFELMKEGASMVPRNLWFVEFDLNPTLRAFDVSRPLLKTDEKEAEVAKKQWRDIKLHGNVEDKFVYATLLGKDLVPFGHLRMRPVVVPVEETNSHLGYRFLNVEELRRRGWIQSAAWLEKAERLWESRRTKKSEGNFPSVNDRLNHQNLLTLQHPNRRYTILYNARGADSMACVLERGAPDKFKVMDSTVTPNGFVCDYTTFYLDTDDEQEAHFISAVLNSTVVHKRVKHFQPDGLYGKRDIGRRPFMLPIPKYDPEDPAHKILVKISKRCHEIVSGIPQQGKGFRTLRGEAMKATAEQRAELDKIVRSLLSR